jgi:RNase adaptor protein for sRNA GlmZ degradation
MIVVVSGLPRSGTSMMMRMLEKANYPMLTDDIREADADNLLGYYEYEPVKNLDKDCSWIGEAEGKVVKIVSPLLMSLPQDHEYKVIFMERDIDEILASQSKMMERRGEQNSVNDEHMREIYSRHLR